MADRVTVLRDGLTVGSLPRDQLSNDKLVEMMTGRPLTQTRFRYAGGRKKKLLEVRNLTKRDNFADVSFDLYEGGILGIAGLIGSGRTELALALFGVSPADSGGISVEGASQRIASVQDAVAAGFAYVPENRLVQGLVLKHSVAGESRRGGDRPTGQPLGPDRRASPQWARGALGQCAGHPRRQSQFGRADALGRQPAARRDGQVARDRASRF